MIKSSVTIALVPEIKQGPWIYWHDLATSIQKAAALGFDGVELFTASAEAVDVAELKGYLGAYSLGLSAIGTGAGKVIHGLTLTDADATIRRNLGPNFKLRQLLVRCREMRVRIARCLWGI